ncbi:MAG: DUF3786 domain-containing protein [Peptococcaceae bacterium]|nr:DUF3786 domain-containing protein [Peptococcaceae bacterium]
MSDGTENKFNYQVTLQDAKVRFTQLDLPAIALRAGAEQVSGTTLRIKFLGRDYLVSADGEVATGVEVGEATIAEQILLLHYLAQAEGVPVQHKLISFKELPGGAIYINPFTNRAIKPLVAAFGADPEQLLAHGTVLGGSKASPGDVSVCVDVFPYVPITLVLWAGDDEFPATGNILFDISAPHYLPTEDYAVLASMLVARLKQLQAASAN